MKHVLLFLISVWTLHGEPIDEDYLAEEGLIPGVVFADPESGVANWDQTLRSIDGDAFVRQGAQNEEFFERETGAHMRDLHEPNNPNAQNRALFFLHPDSQTSGRGTRINIASDDLAGIRSGPRPLDVPDEMPPRMPVETEAPKPPVVHQVMPEPVPEPPPPPPSVPSRYQPVIIHHEDPSNPVRRVY